MNSKEHKKKTISGLKWKVVNQVIVQVFTFGIGILLMRLLDPSEFGLIGMVTVFSGFLSIFKDFGLGNSLIQKNKIEDIDRCTIFYVNIFLGFVLTAVMYSGSSWIANFYGVPRLENIAKVISVVFFIQSFNIVQNAMLKKNMEFKKLFMINSTTVVLGGLIAIYLALHNYGVWTLVYQQLFTGFFGTLLLWVLMKWRPSFKFSKSILTEHLRFGLPLLGTNTYNYWSRNADNLLIGKFLGSAPLGVYSRAYNLMTLPINQVTRVISSVMLPSFALIQSDKDRVKNIFLKIIRIIAFITFPMMGILFIVAHPLVLYVFGEKWSELIFLLKMFAFVGAMQSIVSLNGSIFVSQGETKLQFKLNLFTSSLTIVAFIIGVQYNIKIVAMLYVITFSINLIPITYNMGKVISLKIKDYFSNIKPHIILTVILTLVSVFCLKFLTEYHYLIQIIIPTLFYIVGWVTLMKFFFPKILKEFNATLIEMKTR